ncbi:MAG: hypothetical protein PVI39_01120 [Desulfobacteraceae bacterium]
MVQELMGHADVKTTEIYTHVKQKDLSAVSSPLDRLLERGAWSHCRCSRRSVFWLTRMPSPHNSKDPVRSRFLSYDPRGLGRRE